MCEENTFMFDDLTPAPLPMFRWIESLTTILLMDKADVITILVRWCMSFLSLVDSSKVDYS